MDLRKIVNIFKDIPLSDGDIKELVNGRCNIIRYPDLYKYDNIDQLIEPYGACVLLYEAEPHSGHWCCLTLHDNELEFFDPYGGFPDTQLDYIHGDAYKKRSHQDKKYLSYLLLEPSCTYDLSYNEFKFQKMGNTIQDCGRWCSLRIILKHLTLKEFKQLFYGPNSDDIATLLTSNYSQLK